MGMILAELAAVVVKWEFSVIGIGSIPAVGFLSSSRVPGLCLKAWYRDCRELTQS
jgi:hypothetical protein